MGIMVLPRLRGMEVRTEGVGFTKGIFFQGCLLLAIVLMAMATVAVPTQAGVVTLQPTAGANDGTDDGSADAGKDAGIWPAVWEDKNIGEQPFMYLWNSDCNVGLIPSFIRFSTAGMPFNGVVKAEIALYTKVWFNGSGWPWPAGTWTLGMRRVLDEWNEMQIKASNQPSVDPTIVASQTFSTVGGGSSGNPFTEFEGWLIFDITNLYLGWVTGALPNYGIRIQLEEGICANGNEILVYTSDHTEEPEKRPKLIVTFDGCIDPPSGTSAWWRAEGNGDDSIGTNHGTAENGLGFAAGRVGQAFILDGDDDFLLVEDSPDLRPANFTISAWVKMDSGETSGILIGKHASVVGGYTSYVLWVVGGALRGRTMMDGGIYDVYSSVPLTPGEWTHLALTNDGQYLRIYVNGVQSGSTPVAGTIDYAAEPLTIGNYDRNPVSGNGFGGLIDEVVLFNRALSATEIQAIHAAGSQGLCFSGGATLTVTKVGSGTVTSEPPGILCGADCEETFDEGTEVTLWATPDPAFVFWGWGGDCISCGNSDQCDLLVDVDKSCTAAFERACTYTLNPGRASVRYTGGSIRVQVKGAGASPCPPPDIICPESWIRAGVKSFSNNRGVIQLAVMRNMASTLRQGTVEIGGVPFLVAQQGAPCRITGIEPLSSGFDASGGSGAFAVVVPEGCRWNASTDANWIIVESGSPGNGPGTVTYSVEPNTTGKGRAGRIVVATSEHSTKTHKVRQSP